MPCCYRLTTCTGRGRIAQPEHGQEIADDDALLKYYGADFNEILGRGDGSEEPEDEPGEDPSQETVEESAEDPGEEPTVPPDKEETKADSDPGEVAFEVVDTTELDENEQETTKVKKVRKQKNTPKRDEGGTPPPPPPVIDESGQFTLGW